MQILQLGRVEAKMPRGRGALFSVVSPAKNHFPSSETKTVFSVFSFS